MFCKYTYSVECITERSFGFAFNSREVPKKTAGTAENPAGLQILFCDILINVAIYYKQIYV